jgi:carboxyl-terminal processing protease
MEGALDGAADALDPFTTFVPADQVEAYRAVLETGNRYSGLTVAKDRGVAYVISVAPASPAAVGGLERGDILTTVDGESTRSMPLWQLQAILSGEPGRTVTMSILRGGAEDDVEVTLGSWAPTLVDLEAVDGVPVLRVQLLGEGTADAVRSALATLASDETLAAGGRLLIDLRETVSDDVEAAYEVGRLFSTGELGRLASSDGVIEVFAGMGEPIWERDLVVLQGRGSIGGAEVLASILQDSAAATVVGQRSFGYAGRLSLTPLSNGAHVLLTDAFYTGPDGEPISEGLEPDVEVSERTRTFAEKDLELDDLTLKRALEVLADDAAVRDVA